VSVLPYVVAVWICVVGLYGIVTSRHLLHTIVCVSVVQSSTYVLLLAVGYREGGAAPVFVDIPPSTPAVDPIVQALTLTDVVVGGAVTALLLAIAVQIHKHLDTLDPDELDPLRD
jgi:multicomponent Na+:H+ antiporter subunit C